MLKGPPPGRDVEGALLVTGGRTTGVPMGGALGKPPGPIRTEEGDGGETAAFRIVGHTKLHQFKRDVTSGTTGPKKNAAREYLLGNPPGHDANIHAVVT